ncbi:MAG: sigma 54-interacting transcriptional regulator [Phycisphaerae bacterium]
MLARNTQFLLDLSAKRFERCDYGKLIDALYRVTADRLEFVRLNVVVFYDGQNLWRRVARRDKQGQSVPAKYERGVISNAIRELADKYAGTAQVVDDYATDPDAEALPQFSEEHLSSGLHVYLRRAGKLVGMFSVQHEESKFYSEADARFLFELGQTITLPLSVIGDFEEIPADRSGLANESPSLKLKMGADEGYDGIIGSSDVMKRFLAVVDRVAMTNAAVLILGETGTGKELIARAIHERSRRRSKAMIPVNCAALARDLVSSELFGHEAGAFTGAKGSHKGRFELANRGTLFLDEIGDIPPETQVRLLRVLEEGEYERVGSNTTLKTNVRIIAATHRDLEEMVSEGTFRSDLFFRLNAFPIRVPPLRARGRDIIELADYFARRSAARVHRPAPTLSEDVRRAISRCHWIGNVRELRNVIERSVILCDSDIIELKDLPAEMLTQNAEFERDAIDGAPTTPYAEQESAAATAGGGLDLDDSSFLSLEDATRSHILKALATCNGKISGKSGAAQLLNINPKTLESKMRKLGIRRQWQHGAGGQTGGRQSGSSA